MLDRFEQFSSVVSGINRYIQKLERDEMEKYGYKGAFAQYLVVLVRYPEGMTLTKLCEMCDRDKAAVSRIVTDMEMKGLIVKQRKDEQVYRANIILTEEGRKAAEFVCKRANDAVNAVGNSIMTDEERKLFYCVLDGISKKLGTMAKDGIPEE